MNRTDLVEIIRNGENSGVEFKRDDSHPNSISPCGCGKIRRTHRLIRHSDRRYPRFKDAAVQAAELWDDRDMLPVLKSHSEPELWLRNYISDVINALGE